MATQYVDRAFLSVDGADIEAKSINWKGSADGHEPVKVMSRENRAKGYTRGPLIFELSIVIPMKQAKGSEVDVEKLFSDETLFTTVVEYRGGRTRSFTDCMIKEIDVPAEESGITDISITLDALQMSQTD